MSKKAEMEKEIETLRKNLNNTQYELHRVKYELSLVREGYVRLLRKIKRAMGIKNWPRFKGDFLDGVAGMVRRRLKK